MIAARWRLGVPLCGLYAVAALIGGPALADGLVIPGIGPGDYGNPRPGYRETTFPPQQYGLLGQPVPPPAIDGRPSYRQTYHDFPPSGGLGGGFLEYMVTGAQAEPVAPPPAHAPGAVYAEPVYAHPYGANRATLPQGGLPDYAPGSPVYYGQPGYAPQPVAAHPVAYALPDYGQQAGYDAGDPGFTRQINPIYYRQEVEYSGRERPGTIIIDTPDKFLYLVQPGGRAVRYGIGVGRPGFSWSGVKTISRKAEWPDWTPPSEMLARRPDLPHHMAGGRSNPLGARAMYLGSSLYRIHGTNEPNSIGTNVSSGCIRLMNQDVIDLYGRVGVGTRVVVL